MTLNRLLKISCQNFNSHSWRIVLDKDKNFAFGTLSGVLKTYFTHREYQGVLRAYCKIGVQIALESDWKL